MFFFCVSVSFFPGIILPSDVSGEIGQGQGSSASLDCTMAARPSKPRRISVTPAASQTRVPAGKPIILVAPERGNVTSADRPPHGPPRVRRGRSAQCALSLRRDLARQLSWPVEAALAPTRL